MIDTVGKMPLGHKSRLRVVLESGHKNAGDVMRVYNWAQSRQTSPTLASLTFGDKKTCLPLAAADLFAYSARGLETGQKPIGTAKKPIKSQTSYRGNMFKIMLTRDKLDEREQTIKSAEDFTSPRRARRMSRTISQSLMWDRSSSGGTNSSAMEPTSKTSGGVGLALPRPEPLRQCPGQGVSHLSHHSGSPNGLRTSQRPSARRCTAYSGKSHNSMVLNIGGWGARKSVAAFAATEKLKSVA
jgi:hypothetical protein